MANAQLLLPNQKQPFLESDGVTVSRPWRIFFDSLQIVATQHQGNVTHTGLLTLDHVVVGNGVDDIKVIAGTGTVDEFLHGDSSGPPAFGPVRVNPASLPSGISLDGDDGLMGAPGAPGVPGAAGATGPAGVGIPGLDGDDGDGLVMPPLTSTPVVAGTYGNTTNVAQVTVNQQGQVTNVANVTITGGTSASAVPIVVDANVTVAADTGMVIPESLEIGAGIIFEIAGGARVEITGASGGINGHVFGCVPPVDSAFSWVNQGGAYTSAVNNGVYFFGPASSGATNTRVRVQTAPNTPYIVTACYAGMSIPQGTQNTGICFRESSSGKMHVFGVFSNLTGYGIQSTKLTTATSFSADYLTKVFAPANPTIYLRISDNGLNRVCSWSFDGQQFLVFHTIGRTDFLTADQIGFYVGEQSNLFDVSLFLFSWKVS